MATLVENILEFSDHMSQAGTVRPRQLQSSPRARSWRAKQLQAETVGVRWLLAGLEGSRRSRVEWKGLVGSRRRSAWHNAAPGDQTQFQDIEN